MDNYRYGIFWGIAAIVCAVLSTSCLWLTGNTDKSLGFCAMGVASCALMRTYK